jgi:hypothetical protein
METPQMRENMIRITRRITLDDLRSGRISPVETYRTQVLDWIIVPSKRLASLYPEETNHGMALFALELMFFEPHGKMLPKPFAGNGSKVMFCHGFNRFRGFLRQRNAIGQDTDVLDTQSIYKWARCGLFHSSLLASELLVDATRFANRCLAKNSILGGWLVDPWLLLAELEAYLDAYIADLTSGNDRDLRGAFDASFAAMVRVPLERLANSRTSV